MIKLIEGQIIAEPLDGDQGWIDYKKLREMRIIRFYNVIIIVFLISGSCGVVQNDNHKGNIPIADTTVIYENGSEKYVITYPSIKGKKVVVESIDKSGYHITTYENEKVVEKGNMFYGIRVGYWYFYDSLERVKEVQHLIPDVAYENDRIIYPSSILNQNIHWNEDGSINESASFYYNLIAKSDTYSLSENIKFDVQYRSTDAGDSVVFEYGQFTNLFYTRTPESRQKQSHIIPFDDSLNCSIEVPVEERGNNAFIGAIVDKSGPDTSRVMFVKFRYFVE
jgi:hypothetical protein